MTDPKRDPRTGVLALGGAIAAALLAIFLYGLWSHPHDVPACANSPRSHCGPAVPPP